MYLKNTSFDNNKTMTMILLTLLCPKGQVAEQGSVNTVEKQFKVKLYAQYKKNWNINQPKDTVMFLCLIV